LLDGVAFAAVASGAAGFAADFAASGAAGFGTAAAELLAFELPLSLFALLL
jgi:hypothetical protein